MDRLEVAQALETVLDPEVGIDVVALGLIYDISVTDDGVKVAMTTTAAACPMHGHMTRMAAKAIEAAGAGAGVDVEVVSEPKWGPEMMSVDARRKLGW